MTAEQQLEMIRLDAAWATAKGQPARMAAWAAREAFLAANGLLRAPNRRPASRAGKLQAALRRSGR
jgi:hypothetical protein